MHVCSVWNCELRTGADSKSSMAVSWNAELVRAAETRVCYHVSIGSSREFMWRKAAASIRAVEKDIRLLSSGRIVNMPRLRETTAQQELEAIIRGEKLVVPPQMMQAAEAPPERDFDQHPYLRRMEYRGGGFAILMAFELRRQLHDARQYMLKSEIVKDAQPFCEISMLSTDGWVRSRVCGWASHRSLLSHRLMVESSSNGGPQEYSLTDDGKRFLSVMLRKWPPVAPPGDPSVASRAAPAQSTPVAAPAAVVPVAAPLVASLAAPPVAPAAPSLVAPVAAVAPDSGDTADSAELRDDGLGHPTARSAANTDIALQDRLARQKRKKWAPGVMSSSAQDVCEAIALAPTPNHARQDGVVLAVSTGEANSLHKKPRRHTTKAGETDLDATLSGPCCSLFESRCEGSEASGLDLEYRTDGRSSDPTCKTEQRAIGSDSGIGIEQARMADLEDAAAEIQVVSSQEREVREAETEIEMSSSEDDKESSTQDVQIRLLVDDRERLKDSDPRGLLDRISTALRDSRLNVVRHRLQLGDFAWVAGAQSCSSGKAAVLDCIVERKRICDLVGRSAVGAHVRQMQSMEACGLRRCFLLVEGDPNLAAQCRVYDEASGSDAHEGHKLHVVRSKEDIDDLCARLLIRSSPIWAIMTKDAQGSARALSHLSQWLAHSLTSEQSARPSLHQFEKRVVHSARSRENLRSALLRAGVPHLAAESICGHLHSIKHARDALESCASPEHRLHLLDSLPSCAGLGELICCALGMSSPLACEPIHLSDRRVYIGASRQMIRRLFASGTPAYAVVHEAESLAGEGGEACFAHVCVRAEVSKYPTTKFCSKEMLLAVIPGGLVIQAIQEAVAHFGDVASPANVALKAARIVETKLPKGQRSIRLVIIEGLRAAVQGEARQASNGEGQARMLPNLLGLAELTVLTLDLSFGWRTRVHDSRSCANTAIFMQRLILTAYEEAHLPFDA